MSVAISLETLRRIPLLNGLNESEFRQIADVVRQREFAPGEYVIRQGDQSRDLWIIVSGQCEVVHRLKVRHRKSSTSRISRARRPRTLPPLRRNVVLPPRPALC